jgi:hypothetical protein
MGRKPKTDPQAPGADAERPGAGHNQLSDDDLRELAFQHKQRYITALARKKTADADFKNTCKAAMAEMGRSGVAIIKHMIALDDPEGEAEVRAELMQYASALRWASVPLGTQIEFALTEPDETPSVDRAFDEGKQTSMANRPAKPPYNPESPQYRAFMDGYSDHQATLAQRLGHGNGDQPRPE